MDADTIDQHRMDLASDFLNFEVMDRLASRVPVSTIVYRFAEVEVSWILPRAIIRVYIELEDSPGNFYGVLRSRKAHQRHHTYVKAYDQEFTLDQVIPDDFVELLVKYGTMTEEE